MTIREAVTYFAIDIVFCGNTYGQAPCTAEVGVTGSTKCFNTRNVNADCQDPDNFASTNKTLLFALETMTVPNDIDAIPNMVSVNINSPMIHPGENLGERTTATITFRNHPHGDAGLDLYIADREYIPFEQGTFWGKFRARNPYIKGRPVKIYRGFSDQSLDEMEIVHLFVENFAGPTSKGIFTIKCVDALRFLDGDRALAPAVSKGYLASGIAVGASSCELAPSGIGDTYGTSGYVAIGEEICSFTRSAGSDVLNLTGRGLFDTEEAEHDEEDAVQECLAYDAQRLDQIIYDLFDRFTDLDAASRINQTDWAEEITNYAPQLYTCKPIPKPTAVSKLVNELIVQGGLVINDDVLNQKIKLRALRPVPATAQQITEENMLRGSFSQKEQQEKRATLVITYYNQKNPFEDLDDEKNYYSVLATLSDAGQFEQLSIRKIFSRWIPQFGRSIVQQLNAMILSRYELPPRLLTCGLLRSESQTPTEGEGAFISAPGLENADGSAETVPAVIVSVDRQWDTTSIIAEEMKFTARAELEKLIIIEANTFSVNLRDLFDQLYSNISYGETITFIVESGVIVGAQFGLSDGSAVSMHVGEWPSGTDLLLIINGRVQGAGGDGAVGTGDADPGNTAIYTRTPITIDLSGGGEIWGGGGGGDNEQYYVNNRYWFSDGGAGAGYTAGQFGTPGTTESGGPQTIASTGDSTLLTGYAGGDPGQAGSGPNGGAAGKAIDGVSFVTFIGTGDRRGPEVN